MKDWRTCRKQAVRTITPDPLKAKSLKKTAIARMNFLEKSMAEDSLNFIFEGYYSSLLELLHAHLLEKGFQVENHICLGLYIRDELQQHKFYRAFDDFRYKRNSLIYYGKEMSTTEAKKSVKDIQITLNDILKNGVCTKK